ncbi:uncharacterized protein MYCFIDRAFT_80908 [Pseudocercospora fijiensis CIRAD86]|uniref:Uncharacterized protein n=1 Tax=Pseudocercospora fijiensis (strain CIRAD86) TaxID=383855 RepID=M2ZH78_PSEFD|nr:uncharacterized protein MYCFIDRAFT_80908 [Pseudocercospora fijiensis CIRAD86]EME78494.1 hypothetical protein MYCFIDRAFT_80908 [Pseudocercospora fijiensis CIRAD86]
MLAVASPPPGSIRHGSITRKPFLVTLDGKENFSSTSYPPEIYARQASPYQYAVEKGKKLWDMMINPKARDQRAGDYENLMRWGWVCATEKRMEIIEEKTGGLEEASRSCHIQFNEEKSIGLSMVTIQATHAEYASIFNPTQGAVVMYTAHSPAYMLEASGKKPTQENTPGISHPSDVLFLTWKHLVTNYPEHGPHLRYVFVRGITSQSVPTRDIIWQALRADDPDLEAPPQGWKNAHMFRRPGQNGKGRKADEPFYAVLGTYNFRTIAYMLAQHQQMFRGRVISSIYIWGEGDYLHGMAHIA